MLKPADPSAQPPPDERPVGDIVHQLIEEGKGYARAELGLVKAIAAAKGKALALPAALLSTALLVAQAAVTILAVGIFFALARPLGPALAGLAAFLIFGAIAGGLAWYGIKRARSGL